MNPEITTDNYQVGGALREDDTNYVTRQADEAFYQALKAGKFCYVLNSRQMGKSSLMVRTLRRLQAEGITCAALDFSAKGSKSSTEEQKSSAEQWYNGIILKLRNEFNLSINPRSWLREHDYITSVERLGQFIDTVLLSEISGQIVIFIDEIDSNLRLPFKDDFFALIRAFYNERAKNSVYNRLTFALIGVATPSELIDDKSRTPFNIGTAIDLQGFQEHEVNPLEKGLAAKADNPAAVVREILTWTGGQPFLTQKVCQLIRTSPFSITAGSEKELIEQLVQKRIIHNWEAQDEPEHLRTIRNRLLLKEIAKEQVTSRLLGMYRDILEQGEIAADGSPEQMELRLTGLVVQRSGKLEVYNPIYQAVFNQQWVSQELGKLRPYQEAITAWLDSGKADKSRLLPGKALEDALAWKRGKRLSDADEEFLDESQKYARETDRKKAQILEEALAEAQHTLTNAQQEADAKINAAQRKAKRQVRLGLIGLVSTLIVSVVVGVEASQQVEQEQQKAKIEQQKAKIEQQKANDAQTRLDRNTKELTNTKTNLGNVTKKTQQAEKKLKEAQDREKVAFNNLKLAKEKQQEAQAAVQKAQADKQSTKIQLQKAQEVLTRTDVAVAKARQEAQVASRERQRLQQEANEFKKERENLAKKTQEAESNFQATQAKVQAIESKALLREGRTFDALLAALKPGKQLQPLSNKSFSAKADTKVYTKSALLQAIHDVRERNRLQGHQDPVYSIAYSPDGKTIASGSYDGTIKLWDSATGKELATLSGHQDSVTSIAYSRDGKMIASGSYDNTIRLWRIELDLDKLMQQGCEWIDDYLRTHPKDEMHQVCKDYRATQTR